MKTVSKSASNSPRRRTHYLASLGLYALYAIVLLVLLFFAAPTRADSLWNNAGSAPRSMFADRKAAAKGDILTIVVAESAVAQSSQSKTSNRESALQDSITRFIYPGLGTHKGELPG